MIVYFTLFGSDCLSCFSRDLTIEQPFLPAYGKFLGKISSNDSYFELELEYLRKVFHEWNAYPHWFKTKVMNELKRLDIPREHFQGANKNENGVTSKRTLISPYAGKNGCSIVRYLDKKLKWSLLNNVKPNIAFTGTKVSSNFNVKDPVPFTEKHDIIYWSVCVTESCNEDYVGECARLLYEHVKDNNGRDHSSHLVKQAGETGHLPVDAANFEVIGSRYCNSAVDITTVHAVGKSQKPYRVQKLKPTLNIQKKLVPLKLFN